MLKSFLFDESGISSVEYALLLAFVGGAVIAGATALGDSVGNRLSDTADCVTAGDAANEACTSL